MARLIDGLTRQVQHDGRPSQRLWKMVSYRLIAAEVRERDSLTQAKTSVGHEDGEEGKERSCQHLNESETR